MTNLRTIAKKLLGAIQGQQGGTPRKSAFIVIERLWQRNDMDEDEAMTLALAAQHDTRRSE